MQEIILGIGLFTGIVFVLALLVLTSRYRLVPGGRVTIIVNDEKNIDARVGGKLLAVLAENNIYLPSACGGNGSCGQCRITVLEDGGELLPIESSFISKRQAGQGQRLACQVAVRDQTKMRIELPAAVFSARSWQCRVRSSCNVATYIRELVLEFPAGETVDFSAGGYVLVTSPPHSLRFEDFAIGAQYRQDWQRSGLLALESKTVESAVRAYSMANYPAEKDIIQLNVRIATPPPSAPEGTPPGVVSSYLFSVKAGDVVAVAGPFGEFHVRESEAEMLFVGGGAGMAPLRSHILNQLKCVGSTRKISFWYGARSLREAFYVEQFEQLASEHENFEWHLVLSEPLAEDRWTGPSGFVHDVLHEQYLAQHPAPEDCDYYLCGPPMMMAAVLNMLDALGVEEETIFFDDFGD